MDKYKQEKIAERLDLIRLSCKQMMHHAEEIEAMINPPVQAAKESSGSDATTKILVKGQGLPQETTDSENGIQ
jgi:hypothetical protein